MGVDTYLNEYDTNEVQGVKFEGHLDYSTIDFSLKEIKIEHNEDRSVFLTYGNFAPIRKIFREI